MAQDYFSVYALNRYVKARLLEDEQLQNVYLKGEVSNYRPHPSGHMYFTLKDDRAAVDAMMFASAASKLDFKLENGMKVLMRCYVSLYEKTGKYQIYVKEMQQDGIGNLYYQFEKLKKQLEKDGYFDEAHKKPIPRFPTHIAVLSAKQGDALQDVLRTIKQRYPVARIIIYPIPVQGKDAYLKIIHTLKGIDQIGFSTILLVRGGGSIEELWNFNEEALVKCIYDMKTPVITGVGHETDFTLVDFVSDLRAATPTAAAMHATPNMAELEAHTEQLSLALNRVMKQRLSLERSRLDRYVHHYIIENPEHLYAQEFLHINIIKDKLSAFGTHFISSHSKDINNNQMKLNRAMTQMIQKEYDHTEVAKDKLFTQGKHLIVNYEKDVNSQKSKLDHSMKLLLSTRRQAFNYQVEKLDLISPLKILSRGYSLVKKDNHLVKSVTALQSGDDITITLSDGHKEAVIK